MANPAHRHAHYCAPDDCQVQCRFGILHAAAVFSGDDVQPLVEAIFNAPVLTIRTEHLLGIHLRRRTRRDEVLYFGFFGRFTGNIDAAGEKKEQPMLVWRGRSSELVGMKPKEGMREAFQFAMGRPQSRASEFAAQKDLSIANASMKFKQLWEQGFLLRRESSADTGGVEFVYVPIGGPLNRFTERGSRTTSS